MINYKILSKNSEVKALYLLMNQDLKIIKTVFMPGQKKGKNLWWARGKRRQKRTFSSHYKKKGKKFNSTNYV